MMKIRPSNQMVQNAGVLEMHAQNLKRKLVTVEAVDTGVPEASVREEIAAIKRWLVQTENAFANCEQVITAN